MKISMKRRAGNQPQSKLEKRVSTIGTTDLIIWAENCLSTIGRNVAGLGDKTPERYAEALLGADALVAIIKELQRRNDNV